MIVGVLGLAGRGKTALVEALVGGRAYAVSGGGPGTVHHYLDGPAGETGLADVPCLLRDPRAVLEAVAGSDRLVLAVAADRSEAPGINALLGMIGHAASDRVRVALTFADRLDTAGLARAGARVSRLVAAAGLSPSQITAVSSQTGEGIGQLRDWALAPITPADQSANLFRMSIDRVLPQASGVLVTGRVLSGTVELGDTVTVSPLGQSATIGSLRRNGRKADQASVGDRCGILLPELFRLTRGEVLTSPELHAPTRRLMLDRQPVEQGRRLRLIIHGQEIAGHWTPKGELRLDRPVCAVIGDRVFVQYAEGIFPVHVAAIPRAGQPREPALRQALQAMGWVDPYAWFRDRAMGHDAADRALAASDLVCLRSGDRAAALAPANWQDFAAEIGAALDTAHRETPALPGLEAETLRRRLPLRLPADLFDAAIRRLAEEGIAQCRHGWLSRPWFSPMRPPEESSLWREIATQLGGGSRFDPHRLRDLARAMGYPEALIRRTLEAATEDGRTVEVEADRFLLCSTLVELHALLCAMEGTDAGITVRALRDRIGTGRRMAMCLLGYFDAIGVTRRVGDARILCRKDGLINVA